VGLIGGAVVGLLFPGQGSQYVGMGRDLFESHDLARTVFQEADDALGFALSRLCFDGPESELTRTDHAQPAILTHSAAVLRCVQDALGSDIIMGAGHSLGEFTAWMAAGSLTFADAVRLVRRRGELMMESGLARPGTMAAVLGLEDDAIVAVCERASEADGVCVPANFNSPGQTVISGDVAAVERAMTLAKEAGARRVVQLNVSGAFHSPLMAAAEAGLAEGLAAIEFGAPAFPVVSNVTAEAVTDVAVAPTLLCRQLTAPVRWADCVRTMVSHGVGHFIEIGPGSVLAGLMKRIDRAAAVRTIGSAAEIQTFAAA
jgi:[acyl-carrier-protein] S-malonyltransferase